MRASDTTQIRLETAPSKILIPTRILIVDDYPIFRAGVASLLRDDRTLEVVAEAGDGEQALRLALELDVQLVLMEVSLPQQSGVDLIGQLLAQRPTLKILGLSAHDEPELVHELLRAGATGYVAKRTAGDELLHAIKCVLAGGTYLDPRIARALLEHRDSNSQPGGTASLSEREAQVIRLVAAGSTAKEVAAVLRLSPRTLETYRARAMSMLGLQSRADLIRYALRAGWLKDTH